MSAQAGAREVYERAPWPALSQERHKVGGGGNIDLPMSQPPQGRPDKGRPIGVRNGD